MRFADHGSFRDGRVADQGAFYLSRAKPIVRDLDHIIRAAHEPEVAVRILMADVTGRIAVRNRMPIGFVPLRIFVDRPHHGGPGLFDDGKATGVCRKTVALTIDDIGFNTEKWAG